MTAAGSPIILVAKNTVKKIVDNSSIGQALSKSYVLDGECFYSGNNKAPQEFCAFDQGFDIYRRRPQNESRENLYRSGLCRIFLLSFCFVVAAPIAQLGGSIGIFGHESAFAHGQNTLS